MRKRFLSAMFGIATRSAYAPGWSKPISSPSRQRFSAPPRHMRQRPHHSVEMQWTASPTAIPPAATSSSARGPISTTSPEISCPSTQGASIRRSPL